MLKAPVPFFIVGHERSGTTLLAAAFDRHSRVAVPPETHFFTDLCPGACAHEAADPALMVNHLFRGARARDLNLAPETVREHLASFDQPTWGNLFLAALALYAEGQGKERVGEKTPNHWREVPHLLRLFPGSRVIWVVRDGRDTVLSLLNAPWKRPTDPAVYALDWCRTVERMLALEDKFPGRITRVRFEDLVTAPEAELRRLCPMVGINFEARQLDPRVPTGVVPAWELAAKQRVFTPPDPGRIGRARRELPEKTLGLLDFLMGPKLRRLDYQAEGRQVHRRVSEPVGAMLSSS